MIANLSIKAICLLGPVVAVMQASAPTEGTFAQGTSITLVGALVIAVGILWRDLKDERKTSASALADKDKQLTEAQNKLADMSVSVTKVMTQVLDQLQELRKSK